MKKGLIRLFKISVVFIYLAGVFGNSEAIAKAQKAKQENWKPFKPVENSTLQVISDPCAFATLNSEFTWELQWRPEKHILPGSQIELRSLNLRTYFEWQYTRIEMDKADITMRRPIQVSSDYVFANFGQWIIARATLPYGLEKDKPLKIRISAIPPHYSSISDAVTIWTTGPPSARQNLEDFKPKFAQNSQAAAVLTINAGPVERLSIYSHPMPGVDKKVRTVLAPEDRYGNPSVFTKEIPLKLKWNGQKWTEQIKGSKIIKLDCPKGTGRLKVSVLMKDLSVKDNISNGLREGDSVVVTGNPVWAKSPNGQIAGFGEFHWHTEISGDGGGSLISGIRHARDHYNMNYCAPGDHTPSEAKWKYLVSVLENFNQDDKFATFFGWENSTSEGHDNYYFVDPNHPAKPFGEAKIHGKKPYELQQKLSVLENSLEGRNKFIAIPHHTNAVSETRRKDNGTPYWYQYTFTKPDNYHRLIEVFQVRGNMERNEYTDAWRGWYSNNSSVQAALGLGYKLGFTGGTDCHTSRPGYCFSALEAYARIPTYSQSLTGIWAERIERENVWQALYDRHTWAVWDTRALVYYTVNKAQAGDEITVSKGKQLKARIKMSAEDALQSIEIISEKKTVWIDSIDEIDFDIEVDLGQAENNTYFYLRALQRNGGIIYASPIFVEVE
ncbi:MAG: DUF3604 domain-containing protein [Planctomycetota bacterium]|jgi:hypothetical protein